LDTAQLRFRARQAIGKVRRFWLANINPSNNEQLLARRKGECNRCGACCKILLKCPFLIEKSETDFQCAIYGQHFNQCRIYPIVPKDLEEIEGTCSYTFE
jgi:uncharacterized protein